MAHTMVSVYGGPLDGSSFTPAELLSAICNDSEKFADYAIYEVSGEMLGVPIGPMHFELRYEPDDEDGPAPWQS